MLVKYSNAPRVSSMYPLSFAVGFMFLRCHRDDEKLSLKYIVERTRFCVSLILEKTLKTVTNCSVEKIIPLKYMVERTSCDRDIRSQKFAKIDSVLIFVQKAKKVVFWLKIVLSPEKFPGDANDCIH